MPETAETPESDLREDASNSPDNGDDGPADGEDGTTISTRTRWTYTNDVIAGAYLSAYVALTGLGAAGILDISALPAEWRGTLLAIAGVAAAWTFGTDVLKSVMELFGR